jgi:5-methylcytosine-specific restriction endonuclease McrA
MMIALWTRGFGVFENRADYNISSAMTKGFISNEQCVHCLRLTDSVTADHIFPSSWYPDTTPAGVQRWTVPCCSKCNRELGKLERDLLVRLILCVNPKSEAASGLASKALRSLGIDAGGLSERETIHRRRFRDKIRSELMPQADLAGKPGRIPGLGPPEASESQWSIPIPWAGLAIVAEKIVRGCEYKLRGRFIEPPYGMRIFVSPSDFVPEPYASASQVFEFGPGCSVRRLFAKEDSNVVLYWISVWNTLHFNVKIDLENELMQTDQRASQVRGMPGDLKRKGMQISAYLRNQLQLDPSLDETKRHS